MGLSPDIAAGGALAAQKCAGCHGADGNSVNPGFPRLAGQIRTFELIQLWAFREGERPGQLMPGIAEGLSDQDIADLTAYFSSQTPAGAPWADQDPALVEQGAAIFGVGNHDTGVIACSVCHGMNGEGVEQLGIPRIMGQSPDYLKGIIDIFATAPDFGIPQISAMTIVTSRLSEQELDAVVAFLASQPWGAP
jgi:cytochrome c553